MEISGAGGKVLEGTDESAVEGVDGDAILRVQVGGDEGCEGFAETVEENVLVAAGVEQDGEVDGVFAFAVHAGGVEGRAAVEGDVEVFERDRWELLEVGGDDERGDLDEIGVDVEGVWGGVLCAGRT